MLIARNAEAISTNATVIEIDGKTTQIDILKNNNCMFSG